MMRRARFFRLSLLLFALAVLLAPAAMAAQEAPPVSNVTLAKGRNAGTLQVTWARCRSRGRLRVQSPEPLTGTGSR